MSEHIDGDPGRQQLIRILQSDFIPEDKREPAEPSADDNALKSLLRHSRNVEDIEARLQSENNLQLGRSVAELLIPAAVTDSFKAFLVNEVRRAHAWESEVSDVVAPDRLGIVSGDGIFDPKQAQELEAQALRGYGFDIAKEYALAPTGEGAEDLPPLVLKPGVRFSDYEEALDRLDSWNADYEATYGTDPFEGLEAGIYRDAASEVEVTSEEGAGLASEADFFSELKRLRDERKKG